MNGKRKIIMLRDCLSLKKARIKLYLIFIAMHQRKNFKDIDMHVTTYTFPQILLKCQYNFVFTEFFKRQYILSAIYACIYTCI